MKPEWYYTSAGQQLGPFTAADMKKFAESGKLKPDDLVWKEGMANWVAAKAVKGIFPAPAAPAPKAAEPEEVSAPSGPANDFDYEAPAPGGKRGKATKKQEREEEASEPEGDGAFPSDDQPADFDDRRPSKKAKGGFIEYLTFRKMIVPIIIQIIFWIGVLICLGSGALMVLSGLASSGGSVLYLLGGLIGGLFTVFFGILMVRIYCELLIVSFRILGALTDIQSLLEKRL
ncbi:GYF domain-containing protein [Zavarzinella formosa]|uniref:GYF domain-containing protein n=1 Tax=Zavarzinella formosa TaxID=360055 RepID=UPI0002E1A7D5|nr:GYF domain-containing protein [Zavarzinella formosa]